jgi:HAMP domain-containing protein
MTNIIGFEACSKELRRLLDEVAQNLKAAQEKGADEFHDAVLTETRKLVDFTNQTEAKDMSDAVEVENIRKIDQKADEMRREIFGDSANAIIARMHDRIAELNQLEKTVKQQAAENERSAKQIRLIPVRSAIDAATETIDAFKKARDALADDQADEASIKARIDAVVRALTALDKAAQEL